MFFIAPFFVFRVQLKRPYPLCFDGHNAPLTRVNVWTLILIRDRQGLMSSWARAFGISRTVTEVIIPRNLLAFHVRIVQTAESNIIHWNAKEDQTRNRQRDFRFKPLSKQHESPDTNLFFINDHLADHLPCLLGLYQMIDSCDKCPDSRSAVAPTINSIVARTRTFNCYSASTY